MKKKVKNRFSVGLWALIIILVLFFLFIKTNEFIIGNIVKNTNINKTQDIRWNHMPITYSINFSEYDSGYRSFRELKVKYALERLHSAVSSINFRRVESKADIQFLGEMPLKTRLENNPKDRLSNVAALTIVNSSGKNIITAVIYLPKDLQGECGSSDKELHELLHAFGLVHSNTFGDIMYPYADCTSLRILPKDIVKLQKIYR